MKTFTHNYPSDITREQFEIIREDLEKARKETKPREIDLYSVFCAILYLIKGSVQWRMIPSDYPKRGIVRYYYDVWSEKREVGNTLLSEVLKKNSNNSPKRRVKER
jgi:transposase